MSLYYYNQTAAITSFRANTENQKKMAGVTSPSFVCACCKQKKPVAGRRQAVKGTSKYGYHCEACKNASC